MTFAEALPFLISGNRIARSGWAAGTFLFLVPSWTYTVGPQGTTSPMVVQITAANAVTHWTATDADLLANNWASV